MNGTGWCQQYLWFYTVMDSSKNNWKGRKAVWMKQLTCGRNFIVFITHFYNFGNFCSYLILLLKVLAPKVWLISNPMSSLWHSADSFFPVETYCLGLKMSIFPYKIFTFMASPLALLFNKQNNKNKPKPKTTTIKNTSWEYIGSDRIVLFWINRIYWK